MDVEWVDILIVFPDLAIFIEDIVAEIHKLDPILVNPLVSFEQVSPFALSLPLIVKLKQNSFLVLDDLVLAQDHILHKCSANSFLS